MPKYIDLSAKVELNVSEMLGPKKPQPAPETKETDSEKKERSE